MGEKDGVYDENDPKIKEKLAFLEELNVKTADKLTCWANMYKHLTELAKTYMAEPSKETADFTVLALLSFILALEALPDEGDIVQIGRMMNEIMVMRSDLTGAEFMVGEEAANTRKLMALALLGAVASIAKDMGIGVETDAVVAAPASGKKVLH